MVEKNRVIQIADTVKHGARKHKDGTSSVSTATKIISAQHIAFFILAIVGGFRREELMALTWRDIDFENNQIHITKAVAKTKQVEIIKATKTKSSNRTVTISRSVIQLLSELKANRQQRTEWLFIKANGDSGYRYS